jgi:hypothetical protein
MACIRVSEGQIRSLAAKKKAKEMDIESGRHLSVNFALQL